MGPEKSKEQALGTNLEKKTQEKIMKMTDDTNTMDFVLKNLKLIKRIKRCRVRLTKVASGKFLPKKIANFGKFNSKNKVKSSKFSKPKPKFRKDGAENKKKDEDSKGPDDSKKDLPGAKPVEGNKSVTPLKEDKQNLQQVEPPNNKKSPSPQKPPKKSSTKNEYPTDKKTTTKNKKSDQLPKNKRKEEKKKKQIFIQLPFVERAKMRCLGKTLSLAETVKKHKKKPPQIKRLGRSYLTEKFGGKFFRCHVKVARYRDPKNPAFRKKEKTNRKSVSFVETVEVFGESDDDVEASPSITPCVDKDTLDNTLLSIESDSECSVSGTPRKRKISSLKSNSSPRSERMRKSDEKIPRLQEVNEIVDSKELENLGPVDVPKEIELSTGDENQSELSNDIDKTEPSSENHNLIAQEEDVMDTEEKECSKMRRISVFVENNEVTDETIKEESKSEEESEKHKENNLTENTVNQGSSSICTNSNSTNGNTENSRISPNNESRDVISDDEDLFVDASGTRENSDYVLKLSNNSDISTKSEKAQDKSSESDTPNDLDSPVDTSQTRQTKFSLNTFFKSLKTKIIPEPDEKSPSKNVKQQQRDGDEPIRDELTIK